MLGLAASVVLAQVSTANYVCWADMGYGIVDMSALCATSTENTPEVSARAAVLLVGPTQDVEYTATPVFRSLPPFETCMDEQLNPNFDVCVSSVPVVANYLSPAGRLEVVEDRTRGDFWVRIANSSQGYGPFARRDQAQDWAKTNYAQFFATGF